MAFYTFLRMVITVYFSFLLSSTYVLITATPTQPSLKHCPTIANKTDILTKVTIHALMLSTYNTNVGTVVHVSCLDDDYVLKGPNELTCLPSGQWSTNIPSCGFKQTLPKNHKLVIGLSVGGGGLVIILLIIVLVVKIRRRNKQPTKNLDDRLKIGKQRKIYSQELETKYTEQETSLDVPPNVYKVWSCDRTLKKFITAFDLNDLKQKGCKIFGTKDVYIVLEEDGTEIEDNAALAACKDKTLQVLSKHQSWYKDTYLAGSETIDLREGRGKDEGSEFGTVRSYRL